jgi:CPA2 family monovalent cation:H+ antiporter-2
MLYGMPFLWAAALASALVMSSTAIVSRLMSERMELGEQHGQMVMGILLMQDIAVVPIMILLHASTGDTSTIGIDLGKALVKMVVVLVLLLYLGDKLMRPWFKLVAKQKIDELFMLNVLLVTLGVAYLTELAGLSLALGAFVAGMLISETQYRFQVEDDIRPFRDILLGFFFITIGMKLDLNVLLQSYLLVLFIFSLLIFGKLAVVYAISKQQKFNNKDSLTTAMYLAQGGEFGFVLLALAMQDKLISTEISQAATAAILLSMLVAPFMIKGSNKLSSKLFKSNWDTQSVDLHNILIDNMSKNEHVILVGYGTSGQTIARLLDQQEINYYVLDLDVDRVQAAKLAGEPIAFGNAKRKEVLLAAGLLRAKMVVITTNQIADTEHIIATVQAAAPDTPVIVRSERSEQIQTYKQLGADEVFSDDREMGLVLATQTMLSLGLPFMQVFDIVQKVRRDRYSMLNDLFSGQNDDHEDELQTVHRDSILLIEGSYAITHPTKILEIPLHLFKTVLLGIRRNGRRINQFDGEMLLQAGDVLIVVGAPASINSLEQWLLEGEI